VNAVIYARISNDTEGRELGVQRQLADCRELAARLGLDVVTEYVENDTGASTRSKKPRPQYAAMVDRVRTGGATTVLAYSNSRLSRRPAEWVDLIQLAETTGVAIRTVASGTTDFTTADGRAVALTIAAWDAAEAERTSERTRRAFKANATAPGGGTPHGPIAYGWSRADGVDTIDEAQAAVIREIADRLLKGETTRGIVRDLNARGIPAPRGGRWSTTIATKIVKRERNAARRVHQGVVVGPAKWKPILDDDTFDAVLALLNDPVRRVNKIGAAPRHLLSGLLTCGKCGDTRVWLAQGTGQSDGYACKSCHGIRRAADPLDRYVSTAICARLAEPDALDFLADDAGRLAEARAQLAGLEAQAAQISDAFVAQKVSIEQMTRANATLLPAIAAARAAVEVARPVPAAVRALAGHGTAEKTREAWDKLTLDAQRTAVEGLLTITLLPTTRRATKRYPLDEDAVVLDWFTGVVPKRTRRAPVAV
jgi:DNA invertase Pin-like site-specific DNA recombinase